MVYLLCQYVFLLTARKYFLIQIAFPVTLSQLWHQNFLV